jgi:chloramphenicol-sensitive protein RarD
MKEEDSLQARAGDAAGMPSPRGILYTLGAFLLWGLVPPYWRLLSGVPAFQIPAHRILWTCVLLALFITARRGWAPVRAALADRRTALTLALTAVLVSTNWTLFIVGVLSDRLVEVSMGYFINPLISVVLGVAILRERLTPVQWASVGLALAGVLFQAVAYRVVPWMPLGLAFTFGLYGLLRKTVAVDSVTGTFLETLYLIPLTLAFLAWEALRGASAFGTAGVPTHVFLILAGVVTSVPLVWFAKGARLIPLSLVGFLQYLTPTLHLLIGVVLYREAFTRINLIGFGLIWAGILVFMVSAAVVRMRPHVAAAGGQ